VRASTLPSGHGRPAATSAILAGCQSAVSCTFGVACGFGLVPQSAAAENISKWVYTHRLRAVACVDPASISVIGVDRVFWKGTAASQRSIGQSTIVRVAPQRLEARPIKRSYPGVAVLTECKVPPTPLSRLASEQPRRVRRDRAGTTRTLCDGHELADHRMANHSAAVQPSTIPASQPIAGSCETKLCAAQHNHEILFSSVLTNEHHSALISWCCKSQVPVGTEIDILIFHRMAPRESGPLHHRWIMAAHPTSAFRPCRHLFSASFTAQAPRESHLPFHARNLI